MTDISRFVSEDSRPPIERLRRAQLEKLARSLGIQHPPGGPETALIEILKAHNVDVTRPPPEAGIQWMQTQGTDSDGRPHSELYPVNPPGQSARSGVDADTVRQQRVDAMRKREEEAAESALESENKALKAQLEQLMERMGKLEDGAAATSRSVTVEDEPAAPSTGLKGPAKRAALYREAKERGLDVNRKMKIADLERVLRDG